jgi:hypothetical protein
MGAFLVVTRRVWCSGTDLIVVTLVYIGACGVCGVQEIT